MRSMRVCPPPGHSASLGDGQGAHWGLWLVPSLLLVALARALQTGLKSWLCLTVGPRGGFQISPLYSTCLTGLVVPR